MLIKEGKKQFFDDGKCIHYPVRTENTSLFRHNSAPFIGKDGLGLLYINVEILKEDASSCSGFVFAHPCIFKSRIRLLSLKSNQKHELEKR